MRKLRLCRYLILLVILLCPSLASASQPDVKADRTYYDSSTGLYMLEGNVAVCVKNMVIRAPMARVSLATLEVFAEGGISVVQGDIYFSGDSVFVKGKERNAIIKGNVIMEDDGISFASSRAEFNWKTKDVVLTNVTITDNSGQKYVNEAIYNVRSKNLTY